MPKASDLLAGLPMQLTWPIRVVENVCRDWLQVLMVSRWHQL